MQVITYRKSDGLVFWSGDTDKPDYMGPIMRDTLVQSLVPFLHDPSWYTGWRVFSNGAVVQSIGDDPVDAPSIRHWRARLVTLNMLAASISVERQQGMAPIFGQPVIEHARANGNIDLVQMYARLKSMTDAEAQSMIAMHSAQLTGVFNRTEERRIVLEEAIVRAANWSELQAIRTRINQYLGG